MTITARKHCFVGLAALCFTISSVCINAQTTAFTYQGQLQDSGSPANGLYDLTFELFGSPTNGALISVVTNTATEVANGLFTVSLDFGVVVFDGTERWLELAVATNGGGAFTTLTPRHPITPTPYSLRALTVDSGALIGPFSEAVSFSNPGNTFAGDFTGDGLLLSNVNAVTMGGYAASNFWQLDGNSGTSPGTSFLGTTDNVPLELRVNNQRVFQFLTTRSNEVYNLLGGSPYNYIDPDVISATISGGGINNWFGDARINSLAADFSTIGGGAGNTIRTNSSNTVISGGFENAIQEDSYAATIAGGTGNSIGTNSWQSCIAGGDNNHILNNTSLGTISGGSGHIIRDDSWRSTIGGGYVNDIGDRSQGALIGGGFDNHIGTNSDYAAVGGGAANAIGNDTSFSVIAGGVFGSISSNSWYTVISGGRDNSVGENANYATISGGRNNSVEGGAYQATIGGGYGNEIQHNAYSATIAGGHFNQINSNSAFSVISGGQFNLIEADSLYSTIAGGEINRVDGDFSFAAGQCAQALHDGSFVWADSLGFGFQSVTANQFAVRASGGVRFETSGAGLTVDGLPLLVGPVGTSLIADGSVTTAKLANDAVISSKIAVGAVSGLGTPDGSDPTVATVDNSGEVHIGVSSHQSGNTLHVVGQGSAAIWGETSGSDGTGSNGPQGVVGLATSGSGTAYGVRGQASSSSGIGVSGVATAASGTTYGVFGGISSPNGYGVYGAGGQTGLGYAGFFHGRFTVQHFPTSVDSWPVRIENQSHAAHKAGMRVSDDGFFDITNDAEDASPNFARLDNTGNWTSVSDRRLKRDVQPLSGSLDRALVLEPVSFLFKSEDAQSDHKHIGFIAQDVQKQFPSLVTDGDVLTLNYAGLSVVAISALQELHKVVEEKDARVAELMSRLERVEAVHQKLEQKEAEITGLRQSVNELQELMNALEHKLSG